MSDNLHLAEECYEALWNCCEITTQNGRTELGTLPVPGGGFLVIHRQAGAWDAYLVTPGGKIRTPTVATLRRLLEVV